MSDNIKRAKIQSRKMLRAMSKIIAHAESVADNATTHNPTLIPFNDHNLPNSDVVASELNARGIHSKPIKNGVKIFGRKS